MFTVDVVSQTYSQIFITNINIVANHGVLTITVICDIGILIRVQFKVFILKPENPILLSYMYI